MVAHPVDFLRKTWCEQDEFHHLWEQKKVIDLRNENQSLQLGRDDLTRTGDLAPPRRVL